MCCVSFFGHKSYTNLTSIIVVKLKDGFMSVRLLFLLYFVNAYVVILLLNRIVLTRNRK